MGLRELIARQQAILTLARSQGRELTAEENARLDELQGLIDAARAAEEQARQAAATTEPAPAAAPAPAPTGGQEAAERGLLAAERQRVETIYSLCRDFDMDPAQYISSGATTEAVRAAILEQLRSCTQPVTVSVTRDEQDKFRAAASDALLMRSDLEVATPADGAREMMGMSLRELGLACLQKQGKAVDSLRMSSDDLYTELCRDFYNPSAAFPAIMDQTIRKGIVELYSKVPTTFEQITSKGSVPDFKSTPDHEYVIGGVGDFLLVPENGEIRPDKPSTELLPSRKIDTYGKQFSMTRQAFINDDIGFLTQVPGLYAQAAKKTIDKQVYSILFNNAPIFDGVKFFHASHKNLISGTGAAPSQAEIQKMILQLQKQTDHFGEPITLTPAKLVVGVGYEFDLAVIFHSAQVTGSANNDYNPLYNYPLGVVQTPVLNFLAGSGKVPWFLQATGARGIQVDYLNGQETPTIRRMETPGTLGFVWDIYLDWGVSVRDYRSFVRNEGAVIA